jgi:hypothetical protein
MSRGPTSVATNSRVFSAAPARLELERSPDHLRERARGNKAFAFKLVDQVIDYGVVHPRDEGCGEPFSGIDMVFYEPYSMTAVELDELRERLNAARQRELRRAKPWPARSTRADGLLAFPLYDEGWTPGDIRRRFDATGRRPQQGQSDWKLRDIEQLLIRMCDERDIPYERRRSCKGLWSFAARGLVYELCTDPKQGFSAAAKTLIEMKIAPPAGTIWDTNSVRNCYVQERQRREEPVIPRGRS